MKGDDKIVSEDALNAFFLEYLPNGILIHPVLRHEGFSITSECTAHEGMGYSKRKLWSFCMDDTCHIVSDKKLHVGKRRLRKYIESVARICL